MQLQFDGSIAVNPKICPVFAALIFQYIILSDGKMTLAGDGGAQVDIYYGGIFFRVLLFATEKSGFLARERENGADRFVVGFDFDKAELQVEEKGIVGQGQFVGSNIVANILGILYLSERKFLGSYRFLHSKYNNSQHHPKTIIFHQFYANQGLSISEINKSHLMKSQQKTESTFDHSQPQLKVISKRAFFIGLSVDLFYAAVKLTLIIILFAFLRGTDAGSLSSSYDFQRVQENLQLWEKQIIVDVRVAEGYNCPENYERFSSYDWPGNIQGCSCAIRMGVLNYTVVLEGSCSQKEFAKGCKTVPSHSSIPYLFWKAEKQMCVRRLKNYTFFSTFEDIVNTNGDFRRDCGAANDYQIDLISSIPCPITDIRNDTSLNEYLPELDFSLTRASNYPIASFRVSEYNFCEDFNQDNISPGRTANYILEKTYRHECNTSDWRTITIDAQSQTSLLRNNPRISEVISSLPAYPRPDKHYQWKLGFVRYPSWAYSCRKKEEFSLLRAKGYLNLSEVKPWIKTCTTLLLVVYSLIVASLLWFLISSYLHMRTKHIHGYLYLKDYQIKKVNPRSNIPKDRFSELLKIIFIQIFSLFGVIAQAVFYTLFSKSHDWYEAAAICTDSHFKIYLLSYKQYAGSCMVAILAAVFVLAGLILLDVSYFLWRLWKGDLEEEQVVEAIQIEEKSSVISVSMNGQKQMASNNLTEEGLMGSIFKGSFKETADLMQMQDCVVSESEYSQSPQNSD